MMMMALMILREGTNYLRCSIVVTRICCRILWTFSLFSFLLLSNTSTASSQLKASIPGTISVSLFNRHGEWLDKALAAEGIERNVSVRVGDYMNIFIDDIHEIMWWYEAEKTQVLQDYQERNRLFRSRDVELGLMHSLHEADNREVSLWHDVLLFVTMAVNEPRSDQCRKIQDDVLQLIDWAQKTSQSLDSELDYVSETYISWLNGVCSLLEDDGLKITPSSSANQSLEKEIKRTSSTQCISSLQSSSSYFAWWVESIYNLISCLRNDNDRSNDGGTVCTDIDWSVNETSPVVVVMMNHTKLQQPYPTIPNTSQQQPSVVIISNYSSSCQYLVIRMIAYIVLIAAIFAMLVLLCSIYSRKICEVVNNEIVINVDDMFILQPPPQQQRPHLVPPPVVPVPEHHQVQPQNAEEEHQRLIQFFFDEDRANEREKREQEENEKEFDDDVEEEEKSYTDYARSIRAQEYVEEKARTAVSSPAEDTTVANIPNHYQSLPTSPLLFVEDVSNSEQVILHSPPIVASSSPYDIMKAVCHSIKKKRRKITDIIRRRLSSSLYSKQPLGMVTCSLVGAFCWDDEPCEISSMFELSCKHYFHVDCIAWYAKEFLERISPECNNSGSFILAERRCCCPKCITPEINVCSLVTEKEIKQLFDKCKVNENSRIELSEANLQQMRNICLPPVATGRKRLRCVCGDIFDAKMALTSGYCPTCQKQLCLACGFVAHLKSVQCHSEETNYQEIEDACIAPQYCPHCDTLCEYYEGCRRMICGKPDCRGEFCFLCSAPHKPYFMHDSSYHRPRCDFYKPCCNERCSDRNETCINGGVKYMPGPCEACNTGRNVQKYNSCEHSDWRACSECTRKGTRCTHWCTECKKLGHVCSRPSNNRLLREKNVEAKFYTRAHIEELETRNKLNAPRKAAGLVSILI